MHRRDFTKVEGSSSTSRLDPTCCLNILRENWKPVLTINSIVYGLQYLFLEPNPEDPLNKDAAEVLQNNRRVFEQNVAKAMRGGYIENIISSAVSSDTLFPLCQHYAHLLKDSRSEERY